MRSRTPRTECVSNDLVAKLLAMVMENRELASLIQELVGHEGSSCTCTRPVATCGRGEAAVLGRHAPRARRRGDRPRVSACVRACVSGVEWSGWSEEWSGWSRVELSEGGEFGSRVE